VLLLLTAFTLITLDYQRSGTSPLTGVRSAASAVFGPVERAAAAVVRPVSEFVTNLGDLGEHQDRIEALQAEIDRLRQDNRTSELARNRAAELDGLLRVAGAGQYRVLPARVVAVGAKQEFSWTVTIDAGTRDGISRDLTVLNGDGLVGRVVEVGPWTSTVLLAVDPDFRAGVRLESSMDIGYVTGKGERPLALDLLGGQARVAEGDRLVTQGSVNDRPFVPGVPVGEVISVQATPGSPTKTATVRPYVDFARLDLVGVVVQPPRDNPRDGVLPPRPAAATPTPVPTVTVTVTAPPPAG
jgi:rod shape-determining protein MreC